MPSHLVQIFIERGWGGPTEEKQGEWEHHGPWSNIFQWQAHLDSVPQIASAK